MADSPGLFISFSPSQISGLQLWAEADEIVGLNDADPIATWPDSSGSGNTLTQATGAEQPIYKTGIVNGFPVARFTNANKSSMGCAAPGGQKPVTFFAVLKTTTSGSQFIFGFPSGSGNNPGLNLILTLTPNLTPNLYAGSITTIATATSSIVASRWAVLEATYGTIGDYAFFIDGRAAGSGTNNVSIIAIARHIGRSATAATLFFNGDLAELLQYDTVLSSGDRSNVRGYLGTKYAIAVA